MVAVIADTFPQSPLETVLPEVDIEFSPTTEPHEGPNYRSVMGDVRNFSTKSGRSRELDRPAAGKHKARLDNIERDYDPSNDESPFAGGILPNKRVRAIARHDGIAYPLAAGYADGWPQDFDGPTDAWVDLRYTDAFKLLGRARLPASMYELAVRTDRPTHWWKLHDSVNVSVAEDHGGADKAPGFYRGGVTREVDAIVAYDNDLEAITLDGTTGYVELPPAALSANGGTENFTYELWLKRPTTITAPTFEQVLYINAPGATLSVFMNGTSGGTPGKITVNNFRAGAPETITTAARLDDNVVHHLVITRSSVGLTVYVDGVSQGTDAPKALGAFSSEPVATLGAQTSFLSMPLTSQRWLGTFSHLAFWNSALSTARVLEHYTAGNTAFAGADTGTQAGRILDFCRIPAADRNVRVGSSTIGGYDLDAKTALDYLLKLAETERGLFYIDGIGRVTWTPRHGLLTDARSTTVQATFSNDGVGLPFADVVFGFDELDVIDDVTLTRQGGVPQHVFDEDAIDGNTIQSFTSSGLLHASDLQVSDLAHWILASNKDPVLRVEALVIDLRANEDLIPAVLGLKIGDRIALDITPSGSGTPLYIELYVLGIAHNAPRMKWTTTLETSLADPLDYWIFDASLFDADTRFAF